MLEKEIAERIKVALKSGNQIELSVLRMLSSEIKNKKIIDREKECLSDEKVLSLIRKMAKRHIESIESFKLGRRDDLVEKEKSELSVLKKFLPSEMSESEVSDIVENVIKETGAASIRDIGAVMNAVLPRVKGRADGKLVSDIVRSKLNR